MSGIMSMVLGAKTAIAAAVDAYFNLVTLLLSGDGTNGAQNNTFLDSSSNNFTITRNGNTTQGTFSPFSQTGWSNYFNGSSQLSTVANPNLAFGTGAITFECWINTLSTNNMGMWGTTNESQWTANSYAFNYYNGDIILWNNSNLWSIAVGTLHDGNWHHVAIVRSGTTWQVFADGVSKGTTTTEGSRDLGNNAWRVAIGQVEPSGADTRFFIGYLSNMRVSNTAIYTSNFTPSTTPLTTTSQGVSSTNVKFLSIQSNRFVDNSTNATTFTVIGTPSVQAFSPFAPTAAYSAATNGGSGYFDGNGDYVSAADNTALQLGSGDFTIEFWAYFPSGFSGTKWISGKGDAASATGTAFSLYSTGFDFYSGSTAYTLTAPTWIASQWYHIAIVRNGTASNNLKLYINGAVQSQASVSTNTINTGGANALKVGEYSSGSPVSYISDYRIVKGTAVYTAAFTPPTAPLTAIANTSILLSYTNAGITDATAKNDLETVGNAQISTTQSKFGGSSMYFDGTGDWLQQPISENANIANGDFTIEAWIYPTAVTGAERTIVSTYTNGYIFFINTSGQLRFDKYGAGTILTGSAALSANTWTHIALTRSGNTYRIFINGTQDASTTSTTTYSNTSPLRVADSGNGSQTFTGYIDDLRITKGYARYTANFTAPTAAFALQ